MSSVWRLQLAALYFISYFVYNRIKLIFISARAMGTFRSPLTSEGNEHCNRIMPRKSISQSVLQLYHPTQCRPLHFSPPDWRQCENKKMLIAVVRHTFMPLCFTLLHHISYGYNSYSVYYYTGRFIMFSVITNIYNKKTKGPTLMEKFTATGKLKKFCFDN